MGVVNNGDDVTSVFFVSPRVCLITDTPARTDLDATTAVARADEIAIDQDIRDADCPPFAIIYYVARSRWKHAFSANSVAAVQYSDKLSIRI